MKLREFRMTDIEPIDEIFRRQPNIGVPGFKNMIANATIEDDEGKIVGYGVVKLFSEGVLILDQSRTKRDRAKAVKLSVNRAICEAKKNGIEHLYFLTSNPLFADVLRKHWGFENIKEEVLVLRMHDDEDKG